MPISAKDLSPALRSQFLHAIREQLGFAQYSEMVEALGEEGLLDLYLKQFENQTKTTSLGSSTRPARSWSDGMVGTLLGGVFWCWFVGSYACGPAAPGAFDSSFPSYGQIFVGLNYLLFCGLALAGLANSKEADWSSALYVLLFLAGLIAAFALVCVGIVRMVT